MRLSLNQITAGRTPPASLSDLAHDLSAMRAGGWTAMELWLRHWDAVFEREGSGGRRLLEDAGITATGGCAHPGLFFATGKTFGATRMSCEAAWSSARRSARHIW